MPSYYVMHALQRITAQIVQTNDESAGSSSGAGSTGDINTGD
jgi:hypothetical protein